MSEYVERYIRFGREINWGSYPTSFTSPPYPLTFEATTTENVIEEDIIGASRQARSRVWVHREITGSYSGNILTPRLLYHTLGNATTDNTSPYTIAISGTLSIPSFSIERGLRGSSTIYTGYMGCKIDRYELEIESTEDIVQTIDFVARDSTFPTYGNFGTVAVAPNWIYPPYAYHNTCFKWGDTEYRIRRFRLEINNNLSARFGGECTSGDPLPYEIREGLQEVSGEFVIDQNVDIFARDYSKNRNLGTITVLIGSSDKGTIEIILNNVSLGEFRDSVRGVEPYEITFPFKARPSGPNQYDAIQVSYSSTLYGTIHDALW